MFDKFKQMKKLKEVQDILAKEKVSIEKEGIKVTVTGKMEIEKITLNPNLKNQEDLLKEAINEALTKMQKRVSKIISDQMGGGFPGM